MILLVTKCTITLDHRFQKKFKNSSSQRVKSLRNAFERATASKSAIQQAGGIYIVDSSLFVKSLHPFSGDSRRSSAEGLPPDMYSLERYLFHYLGAEG